jgi:hypothetical protein
MIGGASPGKVLQITELAQNDQPPVQTERPGAANWQTGPLNFPVFKSQKL